MNIARAISLIKSTIDKLELNLSGKVILTEVGSDYYGLLPVIAAMANAERVFAWTRDSSFGKAESNISSCKEILQIVEKTDRIEFFNGKLNVDHLKQADIITNSGFLRPLNQEKLRYVKQGAVIPLMFEKWELRSEDIDIEYCKRNGIQVAGTWESHPDIRVFQNIGPLAVKMAMEAGYEVFDNHIVVWSDDDFGDEIEVSFKALGAKKVLITVDFQTLLNNLMTLDFIFITDYDEERNYFLDVFDVAELKKVNPNITIIHLYGDIEFSKFKEHGFNCYPEKNGVPMQMTKSLGYLGLKPIIKLQVAGLKVGESLSIRRSINFCQLI